MIFNTIGFKILAMPPYFFCAFVGFVVSCCLYVVLMTSKKYDVQQSIRALFISIIGLAIGARIFGCLSGIYRAIGIKEIVTFKTIKETGIVFYGGVFGLLLTYSICVHHKCFKLDKYALDVLAVTIPLFHTITRIGCFLAGCCFGKEYEGIFSVNYTNIIQSTEITCNRVPIQIIEAIYTFILFIYLICCLKKINWKEQNILLKYLAMYSTGRFLLEYFRGDIVRGVINGISFGQFVSVIIWIFIVGYLIKKKVYLKEGIL